MPGREQAHRGQHVGNYRLSRRLGQGGFAEVWLGEHIHLKSNAAIKLLHTRLDQEAVAQFRREARIVIGLRHQHIVQIMEYGIAEDEAPYLIMEYAANGTLYERHRHNLPIAPGLVLSYLSQIADALDFAHARRVIHRDIKPHNMLLNEQNSILLSDFGIATVSAASNSLADLTNRIAGTAPYIAPEQWRGQPIPASDQYSLGITVYEWLTGRRPFTGDMTSLMGQHATRQPPALSSLNPSISPHLERVVLTSLAKDPKQRYPSVSEFARAFSLALHPSVPYPASSLPYTTDISSRASHATQVPTPYAPDERIARTLRPDSAKVLPPAAPDSTKIPATVRAYPGLTAVNSQTADAPPIARRILLSSLGLLALGGVGLGATLLLNKNATHTPNDGPIVTATTPASTIPQVGTTLHTFHANSFVRTVAWSPRGSYLAAGGEDSTVQVWDAQSGAPLHTYTGHTARVNALAWSPDETLLASASDDATVHLWQPRTGQLAHRYTGHAYAVHSISWSPDGSTIASGSQDSTVQLWSPVTAQLISIYRGHATSVLVVAWSPNGKYIASIATIENVVIVWDIATRTINARYRHNSTVNTLAWSPDGAYIASGGEDKMIHTWEANTGTPASTYQGHTDVVRSIAWSIDGKLIASGADDRTIQVWTPFNSLLLYRYTKHSNWVYSLAWSLPDGLRLASGSYDNTVQVWQALNQPATAERLGPQQASDRQPGPYFFGRCETDICL